MNNVRTDDEELEVMAINATKKRVVKLPEVQDGIELKEVDFKEFDRRKAPRMNDYQSFVKSLESSSIEIEFIV